MCEDREYDIGCEPCVVSTVFVCCRSTASDVPVVSSVVAAHSITRVGRGYLTYNTQKLVVWYSRDLETLAYRTDTEMQGVSYTRSSQGK